jgi:hypothetical protein
MGQTNGQPMVRNGPAGQQLQVSTGDSEVRSRSQHPAIIGPDFAFAVVARREKVDRVSRSQENPLWQISYPFGGSFEQ